MSIAAVAKRAGVSVATVSRVLRGSSNVQKRTADQVRRAIEALGYARKPVSKTISSSNAIASGGAVAVLSLGGDSNWLTQSELTPVVDGITQEAASLGIQLTWEQDARLMPSRRQIAGGIAFVHPSVDPGEVNALAERLPLIRVMDLEPPRGRIDHVTADSRALGEMAFQHLQQAGCEHLVFITDDAASRLTRVRLQAFSHAASRVRKRVSAWLVLPPKTAAGAESMQPAAPWHVDSLANIVLQMQESHAGVGILLAGIHLLANLYAELSRLKLRAGSDVHVIACGTMPTGTRGVQPRPVLIDAQPELIGQLALRQLLHRLRNPTAPAIRVHVPPKLVCSRRS